MRIWSYLLKKSLMENFIFCAVQMQIRLNTFLRSAIPQKQFILIIIIPAPSVENIFEEKYKSFVLRKAVVVLERFFKYRLLKDKLINYDKYSYSQCKIYYKACKGNYKYISAFLVENTDLRSLSNF